MALPETAAGRPLWQTAAFFAAVFAAKWWLTSALGLMLTAGRGGDAGEWFAQAWDYTKQIVPLLLAGVLVAGLLLGRPGHEGLIPYAWIAALVGGNSIGANMFATLTEVPIAQGLVGSGMGQGPALSLPSLLVLNSILGARKTVADLSLVVTMATFTGWLFGLLFA